MNWLAHLRLAADEPLLRLGNLAGDFVTGIDLSALHPTLRLGIRQHRAIDRYTDRHPVVRRSRRRLPPELRRVGGILVDVYFDHFLACRWSELGTGSDLPSYAASVRAELETRRDQLPSRLAALPAAGLERWLASYDRLDGIADVLERMERRTGGRVRLRAGAAFLAREHAALADDFEAFWPRIMAWSGSVVRNPASRR